MGERRAVLGLATLFALSCVAHKKPSIGGSTGAASTDSDKLPTGSNIHHLVVVVQENHTFDAYFGRYCQAPTGSAPSCTTGPSCCEAAPLTDPSGAAPVVLDDHENAYYDPDHDQSCELPEIDGGAMDMFVTGTACSDARNFAIAPDDLVAPYHQFAAGGALADRYFQPAAGASSENDMFLADAKFVFLDNTFYPKDTVGSDCSASAVFGGGTAVQLSGTTIADLLINAGESFAFYAEGFAAMQAAAPACPSPPSDCPLQISAIPCDYDPGDDPFSFYPQFAANTEVLRDYNQLATDISLDHLPNVALVKALGYKNEHPGYLTTLSAGPAFVTEVVNTIESSPAAADTLVLVVWDEGGGFFDHVAPPATNGADNEPYGTRVPLIAIGPFVRKNVVSHVVMEHSSIVRFIEYNFLGNVGQLGARDALVNNLGSLLDPATTAITIPQ